jgi:hypothetical protein
MIKIIFISGTPISKIVGDKIDPYWYQNHGFEVEYWGMQNIYYDSDSIDAYFSGNRDFKYKFPNETVLNSKKEVVSALKLLDQKTIICFIDFGLQDDYWLLRLFNKFNLQYYLGPRSTTFQLPDKNDKTKVIAKLKYLCGKIFNKNFKNKISNKISQLLYLYTGFYQKPKFVFCSGAKGRKVFSGVVSESSYISIPSADVCWQETEKIIEGDYCVYVENCFHKPPDVGLLEIENNNINLESFEENICRAFDLIERELGLKVIIAASGKYVYPDSEIFGKREIIYYKLNQLIQHSELVIGHFSQGLLQAFVNYKPIMILYDTSFAPSLIKLTKSVGAALSLQPIAISSLNNSHLNNLSVNKNNYDQVLETYINDSGLELDSKVIITNSIRSIFLKARH